MSRIDLAELLRGRILRGLHGGALHPGDRLPSARELGKEFDADHRVVLAAYRELARDGLVELRQRGGIYVAARPDGVVPLPPVEWMIDLLVQGVARQLPVVEFHDWFRRAVETLRLRAVVVQGSRDQIEGICRELRDDYGIEPEGVEADALRSPTADVAARIRRADLLITTPGYAALVRRVGDAVGVPVIIADVRPDLIGGEWRMLLRHPVYVVVSDERFISVLSEFFGELPGASNLRMLVVGRDDLDVIPPGAPTYVTRAAVSALGGAPLKGRILSSARVFSADAARELVQFIVRHNLAALGARPRG